ncbi:unnamed protein product, partial [Mesorhabditis belari]|uniref:Leucine zipper and ICAT homologous domain-containing protein n=1 Tax=Mesorhabditis belari TaxID=2138241 RepID=A0AAF3EZC7_9BILA
MSDETLIKNLQQQLQRLFDQLGDLEESRSVMAIEEYEAMKADTFEQLKELGQSLEKFKSGDNTSLDQIAATKLAIRSAISQAFQTPEIISLFAKRDPTSLRQKLTQLENDQKRRQEDTTIQRQKGEIILALKALNETITEKESEFLKNFESNRQI